MSDRPEDTHPAVNWQELEHPAGGRTLAEHVDCNLMIDPDSGVLGVAAQTIVDLALTARHRPAAERDQILGDLERHLRTRVEDHDRWLDEAAGEPR